MSDVTEKLAEALRALVGFGPPRGGGAAWDLALEALAAYDAIKAREAEVASQVNYELPDEDDDD